MPILHCRTASTSILSS